MAEVALAIAQSKPDRLAYFRVLRLFGIFSSHLDCAAPITADI
jgi:hypothetical protein